MIQLLNKLNWIHSLPYWDLMQLLWIVSHDSPVKHAVSEHHFLWQCSATWLSTFRLTQYILKCELCISCVHYGILQILHLFSLSCITLKLLCPLVSTYQHCTNRHILVSMFLSQNIKKNPNKTKTKTKNFPSYKLSPLLFLFLFLPTTILLMMFL